MYQTGQVASFSNPDSVGTDAYGYYSTETNVTLFPNVGSPVNVQLIVRVTALNETVRTVPWNPEQAALGMQRQRVDVKIDRPMSFVYHVKITGVILNKDKTPLQSYQYVMVRFAGGGRYSKTDTQGRYTLDWALNSYDFPLNVQVCIDPYAPEPGECSAVKSFDPITPPSVAVVKPNITLMMPQTGIVLTMPDFTLQQVPPSNPYQTQTYQSLSLPPSVETNTANLYTTWLTFAGFSLILGLLAAVWVWWDATIRGHKNAVWWALGTFLVLIVVLPLYLYHRAYGPKAEHEFSWKCKSCGRPITARYDHIMQLRPSESLTCSACGQSYDRQSILETAAAKQPEPELGKHCKFCNDFIPAKSPFCPACGKAQT
jgi:hypothetical protein